YFREEIHVCFNRIIVVIPEIVLGKNDASCPQHIPEMPAFILIHSAAQNDIHFFAFIICRKCGSPEIVVEPFLTDQVGFVDQFAVDSRRFQSVITYVLAHLIILIIARPFSIMKCQIGTPAVIESLVPMQLIMILLIIIGFIVIITD